MQNYKERLKQIENDIFELKAEAEKEEGESRLELKSIENMISRQKEIEEELNGIVIGTEGDKILKKHLSDLQKSINIMKEKSRKH